MTAPLRDYEIAELMRRFKAARRTMSIMAACEKVGADLNILTTTVYAVQKRLRPTDGVAKDYIKSQSLRLAMRLVRKANAEQAMNILSRPNMGVLDNVQANTTGGGIQFVVGVDMSSLGGVKVGVSMDAVPTQPALPAGTDIIETEPIEVEGEDDEDDEEIEPRTPKRVWHQKDRRPTDPEPVPEDGRFLGRKESYRVALARAENKAVASERRKRQEDIRKRLKAQREALGLK